MLLHFSVEAPAIRSAEQFDTIKGKTFRNGLKFTIGLFQRELISMQSNFNSLQKPNQMSERKCLAVFLKDNKWSLAQCDQIFCLHVPLIWWENANFVLLIKAQITRM